MTLRSCRHSIVLETMYSVLTFTSISVILHIEFIPRKRDNLLNRCALLWSLLLLVGFYFLYTFMETPEQFQYTQPYN